MIANKRRKITRTQFRAVGAGLGSQVRVDKQNLLTSEFSLVFDEALQLEETPAMQPSVESLTSSNTSYSFQVLQYNCVSLADNLFAYNVVEPSHVTFLPAGDFSQKSLGRLCAFSLESFPEIVKLHELSFGSFEHLAVACNSKVIHSEINTNKLVATRSWLDLSREGNVEEHSSFSVSKDFQCLILPIKVFPIVFRDFNWEILPFTFGKSGKADFIGRESKTVPVKCKRTRLYEGSNLKLDSFQYFGSFANGFNSKLGRKPLPQILVDKVVQFEAVANLCCKALVNCVLCSFEKGLAHVIKVFGSFNLQFDGRNKFHWYIKDIQVFKSCEYMSSGKSLLLHRLKPVVSEARRFYE